MCLRLFYACLGGRRGSIRALRCAFFPGNSICPSVRLLYEAAALTAELRRHSLSIIVPRAPNRASPIPTSGFPPVPSPLCEVKHPYLGRKGASNSDDVLLRHGSAITSR